MSWFAVLTGVLPVLGRILDWVWAWQWRMLGREEVRRKVAETTLQHTSRRQQTYEQALEKIRLKRDHRLRMLARIARMRSDDDPASSSVPPVAPTSPRDSGTVGPTGGGRGESSSQ